MRKIREVLRLAWGQGLSLREIAQSLGIGHTTVGDVLRRARETGLSWPLPETLDDAELERRLYPGNQGRPRRRPEPDWNGVDAELRRHKGVTLELLWIEYKREHPDGYQYSQFCAHFARWRQKLDVVLRQNHRAGEKMFVDYAGLKVPIFDRQSGAVQFEASLFVAVLGASHYLFCEAHRAEDLPHWLQGHVHAFEDFGGVPTIVVPDNPKTGVRKPCFYEPDLNPSYADLAAHYGVAIIPARPRRPRDKAPVEVGVQVAERWILAVLRHRRFYSLAELNEAIGEQVRRIQDRPFRKREGSRRWLFETLERPALRPLPPTPYVFAAWKQPKVNIDYHVELDANYYSVPYTLVGQRLDARLTATTVEIFHKARRVASHARVYGKGHYVTDPSHRPHSHRAHVEWTPSRMVRWAATIGPNTAQLVETILVERPHPEHGYRSCLGIMRLSKAYPPERMEAAAARALAFHLHTYRSLKSILERGLDRVADPSGDTVSQALPQHSNLRGAAYYGQGGTDRC